jgi:DNA recombination protein RmuC
MLLSQWTPEFITIFIIAAVTFLAIGYLLAAAIHGRRAAQLSAQLGHGQQVLNQSNAYMVELKALLKNAEMQNQQRQVENSRLQEQISALQVTERRLLGEVSEKKEAQNLLSQKLEDAIRQHHVAEKQHEAAQGDIRALKKQTEELRERLNKSEAAVTAERVVADDLRKTVAQLDSQYMKLKTEQEEREASHTREVANFEKQKTSLTEQFKVVSNEILEAKARSLQENSKITLSAVISPFQQSIDSFKKEVQEIHHRETTQQGELRKELESLKALNQQITAEAHELSTALRGQKKLQGNWGELVLENVLDRSGLQLGKDYKREVSFTTEEGRQRPDAVVYLPQGKHLIIDAKVSLNAYTRYINADDEAVRNLALIEHVRAIGNRIRELANRDYYKLPGLNSPEMVFMFIPIESAFVEALKADEGLFQQAIENNVLVATPTTLLTSLNIVRQLWRYEDQNKHTAALANKAEAVFKKLNSFLGSFEKIKKGLDGATSAYSMAENQLVSGKGNLVKQVGEFKNLAPAIKAELPDYFTEKAVLEIDFIPADADSEVADKEPTESSDDQ